MTSDSPVRLRRRAKGARPYFFEDPTSDKLLSIVMALAGEVSVLRDRIDTLERLGAERSGVGASDVEAYQPNAAVRAERDAWREDFLNRLLRVVHDELETTDADLPERYEEAIKAVGKS